ncbi:MAG TPA: DNA repair protein RecO [bacterium]|nr:DNA repair protein RecO [bacterium]
MTRDTDQQATRGIVLRKIPYGEADEIVTCLLQKIGVVTFFASGSRKSKKRFAGCLDYFRHLLFHYTVARQGMWRLHRVEETDNPTRLAVWEATSHFAFASFLAELICDFVPPVAGDHELYELWLDLEQNLAGHPLGITTTIEYLIRLFELTGYGPNLTHCHHCQKDASETPLYFDERQGQGICPQCDVSPLSVHALQRPLIERVRRGQKQMFSEPNQGRAFLRQLVLFSENIRQKRSPSGVFFLETLL